MYMLNLRTSGVADGPGIQVRRGGSIVQGWNGYSDSACGEQHSALTPAFPAHGQTIPSILDIIQLPTKSGWKTPEVFPAALPEWNLTANRFQVLLTFHCPKMASNMISSSSLVDRLPYLHRTPN